MSCVLLFQKFLFNYEFIICIISFNCINLLVMLICVCLIFNLVVYVTNKIYLYINQILHYSVNSYTEFTENRRSVHGSNGDSKVIITYFNPLFSLNS